MKNYKIAAEVYSRVSGYFRPVSQWNNGKKEEFSNRTMLQFDEDRISTPDVKIKNK
jgi:ribonucleoside-triphosphate reductase